MPLTTMHPWLLATVGPAQLLWSLAACRSADRTILGCTHFCWDRPASITACETICAATGTPWLGSLGELWPVWHACHGGSRLRRLLSLPQRLAPWRQFINRRLDITTPVALQMPLFPFNEHRLMEALVPQERIDYVIDGWLPDFATSPPGDPTRPFSRGFFLRGIHDRPQAISNGIWAPKGLTTTTAAIGPTTSIPDDTLDAVADQVLDYLPELPAIDQACWVLGTYGPGATGIDDAALIRHAASMAETVVYKPHPRQGSEHLPDKNLLTGSRLVILDEPHAAMPIEILTKRQPPVAVLGPVSSAMFTLHHRHGCAVTAVVPPSATRLRDHLTHYAIDVIDPVS